MHVVDIDKVQSATHCESSVIDIALGVWVQDGSNFAEITCLLQKT